MTGCKREKPSYSNNLTPERRTEHSIRIDSLGFFDPSIKNDPVIIQATKLRPSDPKRACIIRISEVHYFGSENTSTSIEFAYDSTSFDQIELPDGKERNIYFIKGGFMNGSGPTMVQNYKIGIKKTGSNKWQVNGFVDVSIDEYGKSKRSKIRFDGIFIK